MSKKRTCADCGADISDRGHSAKLCLSCLKERRRKRVREYYKAHKEELNKRTLEYHRKNRERILKQKRKYWAEHREGFRIKSKEYRSTEEAKARRREWCRKNKARIDKLHNEWLAKHPGYTTKSWNEYYCKNKDVLLAKGREYAKTPRGKEINVVRCSKRRATQTGAEGRFSAKDLRRLQGIYPVCVYCGKKTELQVEHVVPLDRGGRNDITNLVMACKSCNSGKRHKTPKEWFKNNPKKKTHFYTMVKEQIMVDRKTGKKYTAYLPRAT